MQQWRRAHGQHSPDGGLYRSGIFPLKRVRIYNDQEKLLSSQEIFTINEIGIFRTNAG